MYNDRNAISNLISLSLADTEGSENEHNLINKLIIIVVTLIIHEEEYQISNSPDSPNNHSKNSNDNPNHPNSMKEILDKKIQDTVHSTNIPVRPDIPNNPNNPNNPLYHPLDARNEDYSPNNPKNVPKNIPNDPFPVPSSPNPSSPSSASGPSHSVDTSSSANNPNNPNKPDNFTPGSVPTAGSGNDLIISGLFSPLSNNPDNPNSLSISQETIGINNIVQLIKYITTNLKTLLESENESEGSEHKITSLPLEQTRLYAVVSLAQVR